MMPVMDYRSIIMRWATRGLKAVVLFVVFVFVAATVAYFDKNDRAGGETVRPVAQSDVSSNMVVNNFPNASVFGVRDVVTTPVPHRLTAPIVAGVDTGMAENAVPALARLEASPFDACETTVDLVPTSVAMVDLTVSSPCYGDAIFVVWHQGIAFSARTDGDGRGTIRIPVLAVDAAFSVTFNNLQEAITAVRVPDAGSFDRVILEWRGASALELHALEFGAKIGDAGHVWSVSGGNPDTVMSGQQGFVNRLGVTDTDMPFGVEVYTYPRGYLARPGGVRLLVGTVVTQGNCGRTLKARASQIRGGSLPMTDSLAIPIPDCTAIGTPVLVPDLFDRLTPASR